jgi:hypothetical protein
MMNDVESLKIPKKIISRWGWQSKAALEMIVTHLSAIGFAGPLTWRHVNSFPFLFDVSETVRVIVSLSRCGGSLHNTLFDGVAVVMSKTIYTATIPSDPWASVLGGDENWHSGYTPCLTYHLSHFKWVQRQSQHNPSWVMTSDEAVEGNANEWIRDFSSYLLPLLVKLKSDLDLESAMLDAIIYTRPTWVKSDGPSFVYLRELLGALQRCNKTRTS